MHIPFIFDSANGNNRVELSSGGEVGWGLMVVCFLVRSLGRVEGDISLDSSRYTKDFKGQITVRQNLGCV